MSIELAALNAANEADFVAELSAIFEHSPWVAEQVCALRPFATRLDLHEAMCAAVRRAPAAQQLALVRAHPELAGRAAIRGDLTAESTSEQAGAGLAACTPDEYARLQTMNDAYNARFGFPFVLSVKGHDRAAILQHFERRLSNEAEIELDTALREIDRIAAFRLAERVAEPAGPLILAMADRLARHSEQPGALTCTFMSAEHQAVAAQLRDWMLQAGMDAGIDPIGNVVGRLCSDAAGAKTLLTGSHYDTVVDGGRYDGRLGILLPVVVAASLRQAGITLPYHFEVLGFGDEEGVRLKSTFLGSSAIAGAFDMELLQRTDKAGITLGDALIAAGHDPAQIPRLARKPEDLLGYVEVHIEQGPVLLEENLALGVVTAIAGSERYLLTITGLAGHSGTVPMALRRDAAAAAAEIVLYVEQRCSQAPGLVGTVGRLEVPNGAVNVIPGRCELSLDVRAPDDLVRDAAVADVMAEIERIGQRRRVDIAINRVLRAAATACAVSLQAQFDASIRRVTGAASSRHLPSGAGHDAMMLAQIAEVGMLFVRCGNGGISHHPAEILSFEDADVAARVFADFLQHFTA
ncbi:MAG: uraD [Hydrocarboniphaga sp.]|uniref:allantoate amidohydrolase n=1 Tax=Hydrocarboniphaga sp. TaxID=2033016 RepID=UPI0026202841|nr:allantoate amidohydrolase [Hydrocarboniphaga sp.]MDB5971736.1 uraD [Hydrocarboniphaga sp.]